jgi:CheY-like chemotaxis protein
MGERFGYRAKWQRFDFHLHATNKRKGEGYAGELILIIEDNEKNRKLVRDVLQVKGYKTIESETAEDGLKLALDKSPALVLMDIQLPGMDGITALKQLRANPQTKSVPVIASGSADQQPATMLAESDGYQV